MKLKVAFEMCASKVLMKCVFAFQFKLLFQS